MLDFAVAKVEVYLPKEYIEPMVAALTQLGACSLGAYDHISSYAQVEGTWRPLPGSAPFAGEVGEICRGREYKLELRCPREQLVAACGIIRQIHPYEEPMVNIIPLWTPNG